MITLLCISVSFHSLQEWQLSLLLDPVAQAGHKWTHYHPINNQRPPESLAFLVPAFYIPTGFFPNKSLADWYLFHFTIPSLKWNDGNKVLRLDQWYWNDSDSPRDNAANLTRMFTLFMNIKCHHFPLRQMISGGRHISVGWEGVVHTCSPCSQPLSPSPVRPRPSIQCTGSKSNPPLWEESRCTWSCFKFHYKSQTGRLREMSSVF